MSLLTINDLKVRYGPVMATNGFSLQLDQGESLALVGSNGAGKSSTMKAIMGLVPLAGGDILWRGESLKGKKPSDIVRLGIGFSPEGRRVFPQLSVYENLKVGAFSRRDGSFETRLEQIYGYFPRLKERAKQRSSSLSGGEQQMLAIGRALMSFPKLFLLDEPSLGLAPIIVERIGEILLEVQKREGIAIILAEQNANWAMKFASRAVILEVGVKAAEGASDELMRDPKVRSAYLGI
jgi:branched-chain amino acid transport system ATP-binding protein